MSQRYAGLRPIVWVGLLAALSLGVVVAVNAPAMLDLWRTLVPETLAGTAEALQRLGRWAPVVSIVLMVLQSVISPLPGSLVAAANGALFGVWWGTLLSWVGSMAGAVVTYALGRWLGERAVARWGTTTRWGRLEDLSDEHGFVVVLAARLTPIISLDFIGYLAGAARMPFGRYLLANALGHAPGMLIYTLIGYDLAQARDLTWQIGALALLLLVLFFAGRRFFARR